MKLREYQVQEIRDAARAGYSLRSISRVFGVTRSVVERIVKRTLWRHLPDVPGPLPTYPGLSKPEPSKLTAERVQQIRAMLRAGDGPSAIARRFEVSETSIYAIKRKWTWNHLPEAGALVRVGVRSCQRCEQDHEMEFRLLSNPADEFTHWGLCPTLAEPVLLAMRQADGATEQGTGG